MKKTLAIIAFALAFALPSFAHADITSNLQGWWTMNDGTGTSVADGSGNSNTGTFGGYLANPNWVYGNITSYATAFSGAPTYVSVAAGSSLNINTNITMSAWVYQTSQSQYEEIFSDNGNTGYRWRITTSGTVQMLDQGGTNDFATSATVPLNTWTHLAVVGNSSGFAIYINGSLSASGGSAFNGGTGASTAYIGAYATGSGPSSEGFIGYLEDVRVYNRALNSTDISQLYAYTNVQSSITNGLVGNWKFDEGSGSTATDSGSGSHNGTEYGTPPYVSGHVGPYALSFNGSTQYVDMGNYENMGTNDMTISAWVQTTSSGTQCVINKSYAGTGNYRYTLCTVSGNAYVFLQGNGGSDVDLTGSKVVNDGNWHLITVVFQRLYNVSIYVDGGFDTSAAMSQWNQLDFESTNPFRIGTYTASDNSTPVYLFTGYIDDPRVYNRALTTGDIALLYANKNGSTSSPSSSFSVWLGKTLEVYKSLIIY